MREGQQRFFLDVEDAAFLDIAVGGQRNVHQRAHRKVAGDVAHGRVDPVRADAARAPIGNRAHQGREVEFIAIGLASHDLTARPHRLELAAHQADTAQRILVGTPLIALDRGGFGDHAAVMGMVAATLPVPLGICHLGPDRLDIDLART